VLTVFWLVFWLGMTLLTFAAGVSLRSRLGQGPGDPGPVVDDAAVRAILETGRLITDDDEPTDPQEVEDEERRFWAEDWEEPEEW